jgi:hypothetical protein
MGASGELNTEEDREVTDAGETERRVGNAE